MKFKSLLILPLLVASLQAASFSDLTFTLNGNSTEYSVTDCLTAASDSLDIPSTYNGLPVTSIALNAFDGTGVTSLSFSNALLEAVKAERDARLTMDEVRDARVGSTMIEVSGAKADITLTLEETSDLNDWSSAETSDKTIQVDAPAGIRFYRFKITE